jgi:DNA-binding PadR family transcriptional regulator
MAALNNTQVAILLVLNREPRSGYEVKQFVDKSARYFWAASYGRIYPELKRLTEAGLIEGTDDSLGARAKTVFALTDAGRHALGEWYAREPEILELKDEAMLKVFFGAAFEPTLVAEHVAARRRQSQRIVDELRAIEPLTREQAEKNGDPYPHETVLCGIQMNESVVAWCDAAERHLAPAKSKQRSK